MISFNNSKHKFKNTSAKYFAKKTSLKGFTLMEMSIVIVIIGLIAGSIFAGTEVVDSYKRQAIISEVNNIKTALYGFKAKYDDLPGDFANAQKFWGVNAGGTCGSTASSSGTCVGDGDGTIDKNVNGFSGGLLEFEPALFWEHLSLAELVDNYYSFSEATMGSSSNIYVAEQDIANKLKLMGTNYGTGIGYMYYNRSNLATGIEFIYEKTGNVLELGKCGSNYGTENFCSAPFLTASEAKSIDEKMDDGAADTGNTMAVNGRITTTGNTAGCAGNAGDLTGTFATGSTSTTTAACRLFFWLEEE